MKQEMIMVRYGELSTKGKNIGDFIKMLGNNIKRALKKYQKLEYRVSRDHIYITLNEGIVVATIGYLLVTFSIINM